jgi:hypothetical protein
MRGSLVALLATTPLLLAAPANADSPVQHLTLSFEEEPVVSTIVGLGPDCPDLVGTMTENRHLQVDGWVRSDGSAHASTDVTAVVTIFPTASGGTSFTGGYIQHQTGQFTAFGEDERVVTTTTRGTLRGSDGSTYRISEVSHVVIHGAQLTQVWFDHFRCEPDH